MSIQNPQDYVPSVEDSQLFFPLETLNSAGDTTSIYAEVFTPDDGDEGDVIVFGAVEEKCAHEQIEEDGSAIALPSTDPDNDTEVISCKDVDEIEEVDKDKDLDSDKIKEEKEGLDALIKTFYEGSRTCTCCFNWVEKQPTQVPEFAQKKYDRAAIRIYKVKRPWLRP